MKITNIAIFALILCQCSDNSREIQYNEYMSKAYSYRSNILYKKEFLSELLNNKKQQSNHQLANELLNKFHAIDSINILKANPSKDFSEGNIYKVKLQGLKYQQWDSTFSKSLSDNMLSKLYEQYNITEQKKQQKENQRKIEEEKKIRKIVEQRIIDAQNGTNPREERLKKEIRSILSSYQIVCTDLGVSDGDCLWVFTLDDGTNKDGLAKMLCPTASEEGVYCVKIWGQKQNELGGSYCK